jgi:hypothetical protein
VRGAAGGDKPEAQEAKPGRLSSNRCITRRNKAVLSADWRLIMTNKKEAIIEFLGALSILGLMFLLPVFGAVVR